MRCRDCQQMVHFRNHEQNGPILAGRIRNAVMERQQQGQKEKKSTPNTPPMAKATIIKDGGNEGIGEGHSEVEEDADEGRSEVEEEHKGLIV